MKLLAKVENANRLLNLILCVIIVVMMMTFFLVSGVRPTCNMKTRTMYCILGDPGADSGGEEKSKRAEKYGMKNSKERRKEPLGTMSYQTSSKRPPPFWLLIGARKLLCFSAHQKAERRQPFGTGLVRHCP